MHLMLPSLKQNQTTPSNRDQHHLMNGWWPNNLCMKSTTSLCSASSGLGFTIITLFTGSKRARIISDSNNDTCSESPPQSPQMKHRHATSLSPTNHHNLGSSGSDLDVDSTPDMDTPENLSVKRDDNIAQPDTLSPTPMTTALDNISLLRHYSKDYHNSFLMDSHKKLSSPRDEGCRSSSSPQRPSLSPPTTTAQQQHHQMQQNILSTSPTSHRSPIDLLLRVFPTQKRNEVENLLQRNRGNIIQTMEALIYGEDNSVGWVSIYWLETVKSVLIKFTSRSLSQLPSSQFYFLDQVSLFPTHATQFRFAAQWTLQLPSDAVTLDQTIPCCTLLWNWVFVNGSAIGS